MLQHHTSAFLPTTFYCFFFLFPTKPQNLTQPIYFKCYHSNSTLWVVSLMCMLCSFSPSQPRVFLVYVFLSSVHKQQQQQGKRCWKLNNTDQVSSVCRETWNEQQQGCLQKPRRKTKQVRKQWTLWLSLFRGQNVTKPSQTNQYVCMESVLCSKLRDVE